MSVRSSVEYDLEMSILILGNTSVGKTSILRSFMGEPYLFGNSATVGVDMKSRIIQLEDPEKVINLILWDAAGQNTFKTVVHSYIRRADCYVLAFDVTSQGSFSDVDGWLKTVEDKGGYDNCDKPTFLMGNKIDKGQSVCVSFEDAEACCSNYGRLHDIPFMVSAKTGEGVDEAFYEIADVLYRKVSPERPRKETVTLDANRQSHQSSAVSLDSKKEKNKCGCELL